MLKKFIKKILSIKDGMSFKTAFDLCEIPVVVFHQGKKKFNFLLDSGSNNSVIDSNVLSEIEYKPSNHQTYMVGMGSKEETLNSMCDITLSFEGKDYTYEYVIQDMSVPFGTIKQKTGVNIHGIIGTRFFNKFKYVLDFDELIAYSKK